MTDTRNNGGPAFPQISELGDIAATSAGMSLRDWFAGQALVGEIASMDVTQQLSVHDGESTSEALDREAMRRAEWCYRQADAMLTTRSSSKEA